MEIPPAKITIKFRSKDARVVPENIYPYRMGARPGTPKEIADAIRRRDDLRMGPDYRNITTAVLQQAEAAALQFSNSPESPCDPDNPNGDPQLQAAWLLLQDQIAGFVSEVADRLMSVLEDNQHVEAIEVWDVEDAFMHPDMTPDADLIADVEIESVMYSLEIEKIVRAAFPEFGEGDAGNWFVTMKTRLGVARSTLDNQ